MYWLHSSLHQFQFSGFDNFQNSCQQKLCMVLTFIRVCISQNQFVKLIMLSWPKGEWGIHPLPTHFWCYYVCSRVHLKHGRGMVPTTLCLIAAGVSTAPHENPQLHVFKIERWAPAPQVRLNKQTVLWMPFSVPDNSSTAKPHRTQSGPPNPFTFGIRHLFVVFLFSGDLRNPRHRNRQTFVIHIILITQTQ